MRVASIHAKRLGGMTSQLEHLGRWWANSGERPSALPKHGLQGDRTHRVLDSTSAIVRPEPNPSLGHSASKIGGILLPCMLLVAMRLTTWVGLVVILPATVGIVPEPPARAGRGSAHGLVRRHLLQP